MSELAVCESTRALLASMRRMRALLRSGADVDLEDVMLEHAALAGSMGAAAPDGGLAEAAAREELRQLKDEILELARAELDEVRQELDCIRRVRASAARMATRDELPRFVSRKA